MYTLTVDNTRRCSRSAESQRREDFTEGKIRPLLAYCGHILSRPVRGNCTPLPSPLFISPLFPPRPFEQSKPLTRKKTVVSRSPMARSLLFSKFGKEERDDTRLLQFWLTRR